MKYILRILTFFFLLEGLSRPVLAGDESKITITNLTYKPGQFGITALTGTTPEKNLKVLVQRDGEPLTGITVYFNLIQSPSREKGAALGETEVVTDAGGIASTAITLGGKPGKYRVTAFVPGARGSPVVFTINTHQQLWLIFLLISLLGGLAVFLFGMTYMSDSLQKLGGHQFVKIVERATSNRFKALAVGTLVTAIIQSSSATTVMVVGLINSGLMQFVQSIGIVPVPPEFHSGPEIIRGSLHILKTGIY